MKRHQTRGHGDRKERLVGAVWDDLTSEDQQAALLVAHDEGSQAARRYLGAPYSGSISIPELRNSPWAHDHDGLDRLPDDVFVLYMTARTIPVDDDYVGHVVERLCPERAEGWWGAEPDERRRDPRVCVFCDAFERERCVILGVAPPPCGIADLQLNLWQAKEQEREQAREWMEALEASYASEEDAETQWAVSRFEYLRCQWVTDLAQMLLDAAAYPGPRGEDRRAAA